MLESNVFVSVYKVFLSFFALILLNGCSNLHKQCKNINWHEIGRQDSALDTDFKKSLVKRQKNCPIQNDSVYVKAYRNGFLLGIKEYCNFKAGYSYGLTKAQPKTLVCPKTSNFKEGYEAGVNFSKIRFLGKELEKRLTQIESKIKKTTATPKSDPSKATKSVIKKALGQSESTLLAIETKTKPDLKVKTQQTIEAQKPKSKQ